MITAALANTSQSMLPDADDMAPVSSDTPVEMHLIHACCYAAWLGVPSPAAACCRSLCVCGVRAALSAAGLPVFAVGNVAYEALAKLLLHLGAGPGGSTHVVVTDVREELVVYVNGEFVMSYQWLHRSHLPLLGWHHRNGLICNMVMMRPGGGRTVRPDDNAVVCRFYGVNGNCVLMMW